VALLKSRISKPIQGGGAGRLPEQAGSYSPSSGRGHAERVPVPAEFDDEVKSQSAVRSELKTSLELATKYLEEACALDASIGSSSVEDWMAAEDSEGVCMRVWMMDGGCSHGCRV
jgi:hypothetical protein